MFAIFKSKPVQLLCIIILTILTNSLFSDTAVQFFYTISYTIKELLIMVLPLIIFSCILNSMIALKSGAIKLIIALLTAVCVSNFCAAMISYFIGTNVLLLLQDIAMESSIAKGSNKLLWDVNIIKIISNDKALLVGVIFGVFINIKPIPILVDTAKILYKYSMKCLYKGFLPILPIFIFGFILNFASNGSVYSIIDSSGIAILITIFAAIGYVLLLYIGLSGIKLKRMILYIKNVTPVVITAFSTMSSAAAMPLAIIAARKSSGNKSISAIVVPATVNIHLIGDGIFIPLMALIILNLFGMPIPDFKSFTIFACFFVIAKFAVAAVPGGGILVMIPILEKYLNFTTDMSLLITAFYILLDPIITSVNVIGNNIMTIMLSRLRL